MPSSAAREISALPHPIRELREEDSMTSRALPSTEKSRAKRRQRSKRKKIEAKPSSDLHIMLPEKNKLVANAPQPPCVAGRQDPAIVNTVTTKADAIEWEDGFGGCPHIHATERPVDGVRDAGLDLSTGHAQGKARPVDLPIVSPEERLIPDSPGDTVAALKGRSSRRATASMAVREESALTYPTRDLSKRDDTASRALEPRKGPRSNQPRNRKETENCCATSNSQGTTAGLQALEHYPQAANPSIPWHKMWGKMRDAGWSYLPGNNSIAWYLLHPSVANIKKRKLFQPQYTKGIHYFTTEKALHEYAKKYLGWEDECAKSPPTTPLDGSTCTTHSMSKKRKQSTVSPMKGSRTLLERNVRNKEGALKQHSSLKISSPLTREVSKVASSSPRKNPESDINYAISASLMARPTEETTPLPDTQLTVRHMLDACELMLDSRFKNNVLIKAGPEATISSRESKLRQFMINSVRTGEIVDGGRVLSPRFIYLCGGPGTGKVSGMIAHLSTYSDSSTPTQLKSSACSDYGCGIVQEGD